MEKTIKNIGLDVHKNSISIGIADEGRDGEVRYYGKIDNDMKQLDKVPRKLISKEAVLKFIYEAGTCGYSIYRHLTVRRRGAAELLQASGLAKLGAPGKLLRGVVAPSKIPRQNEICNLQE